MSTDEDDISYSLLKWAVFIIVFGAALTYGKEEILVIMIMMMVKFSYIYIFLIFIIVIIIFL